MRNKANGKQSMAGDQRRGWARSDDHLRVSERRFGLTGTESCLDDGRSSQHTAARCPFRMTDSQGSSNAPRRLLRRLGAAQYCAISPSLFDAWVRDGRMPQGHLIGGVRLWDVRELDLAIDALLDPGKPTDEDPTNWSDVSV